MEVKKNTPIIQIQRFTASPTREIHRGEIYTANLGNGIGFETKGVNQVLVVSNNVGNSHSGVVQIAPIKTYKGRKLLPTHVRYGNSVVMTEQTRTIDKSRLLDMVDDASDPMLMALVDNALAVSFGIAA